MTFIPSLIILKIVCTLYVINTAHCSAAYSRNNDNRNVKITIGAAYNSDRVYRGAMIWPKATLYPLAGIILYNKFAINGPGVSSMYSLGPLTASIGFRYFDDNEPIFYLEKHNEDYRNQRKASIDLNGSLALRFMPGGRLALAISQGIKGQYGFYTNGSLELPIFPLASAGYSIGYGDTKANRYAYGPEGIAGLGHQDIYFKLTLPFLPWGGRLITRYTFSRIHKTNNKNADYVRGDDKSNTLTIMTMWNI